jgi:hypothetical protein
MVMLLLIVLGRSVAFAQFNPEDPPEPDVQPVLYTVSVKTSPEGIADVSGGGEYAEGTEISLNTSLYNSSYVFKHWTKDGVKYSENTSFNYTVTDSDVTFVAVYQFQPVEPEEPETDVTYELNLSAIPSDACSFNRANGEKIEEKIGFREVTVDGNTVFYFECTDGMVYRGAMKSDETLILIRGGSIVNFEVVPTEHDSIWEIRGWEFDPSAIP